jgi:hypothetical protein
MIFSTLLTLRKVFFGATMLGLIIWRSDWAAPALQAMNFLIPAVAALALVNEIALVIHRYYFFEQVQAQIVPSGDTRQHNVTVKNYELRFDLDGMTYTMPHQDSIFSRPIDISRGSCQVLVHKKPPRIAIVDTFAHRYMNLMIAFFLLCSVYSAYYHPM